MTETAFAPELKIELSEHLYDVHAHFTNVTDFGINMQELLMNPDLMPPQGARFNIEFEGNVVGEKLSGKIKGVDYIYMRADGHAFLDVHAVISTATGAKIYLTCSGISMTSQDPSVYELRESVELFTDDPYYNWVNQIQIWARGRSDLKSGEIDLQSFVA